MHRPPLKTPHRDPELNIRIYETTRNRDSNLIHMLLKDIETLLDNGFIAPDLPGVNSAIKDGFTFPTSSSLERKLTNIVEESINYILSCNDEEDIMTAKYKLVQRGAMPSVVGNVRREVGHSVCWWQCFNGSS